MVAVAIIAGIPDKLKTGVSFFAMQSRRFPCEKALQIARAGENIPIAILWGSFGNDNRCLSRYLNENPEASVVVHMSNEVSRRKNSQCRGDLLPNMNVRDLNDALEERKRSVIGAYKKRLGNIVSFFDSHETHRGKVIISVGLEDNYTDRATKVLLSLLKKNARHKVLRNPVGSVSPARCYGRSCFDYIELHGSKFRYSRGKNLYSNDGQDLQIGQRNGIRNRISPTQLLRRIKRLRRSGVQSFVWAGVMQGLKEDSGNSPCPRNRRIRFGKRLITEVRRLLISE